MFRYTTADFDFDAPPVITTTLSSTNKILASMIDGASMLVDNTLSTGIKYKGSFETRHTAIRDEVDVYRNLNKPNYFSCKCRAGDYKGKVSGYANIIVLEGPEFVVSEVSRQRVLKDRSRNVHAYVRGRFLDAFEGKLINPENISLLAVSYSPYLGGHFFRRDNHQPITRADYRKFAIIFGANVYLTDLNRT